MHIRKRHIAMTAALQRRFRLIGCGLMPWRIASHGVLPMPFAHIGCHSCQPKAANPQLTTKNKQT